MTLINVQQTDVNITYTAEGKSIEEISNIISTYFRNQGYGLEKGTKENGVYGIGNDLLRIVLGAFVKRYKFQITVSQNENHILVTLSKAMSGVSGGVIGYSKLQKEYAKVTEELKSILA